MTPEERQRALALLDEFVFWTSGGSSVAYSVTREDAAAKVVAFLRSAEERGAAAEREECAQTAQETPTHLSDYGSQMRQHYKYACEKAAGRIRARGSSEGNGDG